MTPLEELNAKAVAEEIARRAIELIENDDDFETNVEDLANDYKEKVERSAGVLARLLSDKPSKGDIFKRSLARGIAVALPVATGVGVMLLTGNATLGTAAAGIVVGAETAAKVRREVAKTRGEASPSWANVAGRLASIVFDIIKLLTRKGTQ